jgi:hypothetical protein
MVCKLHEHHHASTLVRDLDHSPQAKAKLVTLSAMEESIWQMSSLSSRNCNCKSR